MEQLLSQSGIAFERYSWKKPPPYPYGVVVERVTNRGGDNFICIKERDITIEVYHSEKKGVCEAAKKVENVLMEQELEFDLTAMNWIEKERHWRVSYSVFLVEKIRRTI